MTSRCHSIITVAALVRARLMHGEKSAALSRARPRRLRRAAGFTVTELLFVIGTLVLFALILPALLRPKGHRCRCGISCFSNLKQIGLALRMFANDYGERFPMQVSVLEGGTKEIAFKDLALASFTSISNELNNPKPLACPQDSECGRAITFEKPLAATNVSYFLGIDASETNAASILAGDRNILVNGWLATNFVAITNPMAVGWGARIHNRQGNVGLADGSVHHMNAGVLQNALGNSGLATNRLVFP